MRVTIALLVILSVAWASPAGKEKTTNLACSKKCTEEYTPICAAPKDGKGTTITFGSRCVMENYNCENQKSYVVKQQGECGDKSPVRLS